MPFRPFGDRFDLTSSLTPAEVRAAIRKHKTPWFGARKAVSGWIVGRFVALQWGHGRGSPALYGWISRNDGATWIGGRTGHEPLLRFLRDALSPEGPAPLVKTLRDPHSPEDRARNRRLAAIPLPAGLTLDVNGKRKRGTLTQDSIRQALDSLFAGDFVILKWSPTRFLQLALSGPDWVLENYDGDREEQCVVQPKRDDPNFAYDEILAVLIAYASGAKMPSHVTWRPIGDRD